MESEPSAPTRFTVSMQASVREKAARESTIGTSVRWRLNDDVMLQGVVVDWQDEPDGSVTLTVEASSPES